MRQIERTRRVPAQEMADREPRLLITGDPGSGKSTFVKHMAYLLASAAQRAEPAAVLAKLQPWSHELALPVYIELRSVAVYAAENKHTEGSVRLFKQYLAHLLDKWGVSSAWDALHRALENGQTPALFLLDGLDEVNTNQRKLLVQMVNALAADPVYCRHRLIVTCRPYAYYDMPADHRLRSFTEVTLAPFSPEQVDRFVENWYRRLSTGQRPLYSSDEAQARIKDLHGAVRRRDHRSLARRPILLTMMVQLHTFSGRLPVDRVRLYKESVDLLLKRWNARSHDQPPLRDFLGLPDLKEENVEKAIFEIAFRAHAAEAGERAIDGGDEEPSADITESDLRTWVRPYLGGSDPHADLFIQYIRERAGLLVRHKTDAYTFPHRSLQEFLAACHLTRSDEMDYKVDAAKLVRADATRWREAFVLAAGYEQRYGKTSNAVAAINELCPEPCPEPDVPEFRWTPAQIAADALLEIGFIDAQRSEAGRTLWVRVQEWLAALVAQQRSPPAKSRVAAGVTLAKLGDSRPGVLDPLQMEFCHVPAGPFVMREEKDQYEHDLPYAYWISRFPVTNAHYQTFMAAGGYAEERWWAEAKKDRNCWKGGKFFDRQAPYGFGEPFDLSNHPVVGVSWYEALAFTRWLDEHYRSAGLLPPGLHVNLPNEPEWEKAARVGIKVPAASPPVELQAIHTVAQPSATQRNTTPQRTFPWGNDANLECVNTRDSQIGSTSAAGTFIAGASPYGVEEMSGNVHEWTRSLWSPESTMSKIRLPYRDADGREKLAAGPDADRVFRGGGFETIAEGGRCAARDALPSDLVDSFIGFRVVLSPFTSGL